jgi:hypothetical protein
MLDTSIHTGLRYSNPVRIRGPEVEDEPEEELPESILDVIRLHVWVTSDDGPPDGMGFLYLDAEGAIEVSAEPAWTRPAPSPDKTRKPSAFRESCCAI